jgi:hypothetical protein
MQTPQEQLAAYVTNEGFTFADYQVVYADVMRMRGEAQSCGSFADIPTHIAKRHLDCCGGLRVRLRIAARQRAQPTVNI